MRFHALVVWLVAISTGVPGVGAVEVAPELPDWPMWRYDAARSAQTPLDLDETLHLQWVRELPVPERAWPFQWDDRGKLDFDVSYAPVVMGRRIFVPSNVTDSVTAYDIEDGRELWRFHADGPVRLAPAAWRNRVYFTSDDGHLYCVDAQTGELDWTFRAGPSDARLLGNERIINVWAARGGPVVDDGTVYFAAGVFPLHGIFIYALDAESGEVQWVNDTTSSDYVELPHGGADGFGGLSPQGYIAVSGDELVVAPGRGQSPVVLDRRTGETRRYSFRGNKGGGGYAVHSEGQGYQRNSMLQARVKALSGELDGEVFYKLGAQDRLFVVTVGGTIYCFGPEEREATRHAHRQTELEPLGTGWADIVQGLLGALDRQGLPATGGESAGYALVLGKGSGDLLRELVNRSALHVVVVEKDPAAVKALRDELVGAGRYGRKGAAVIEADPATFAVQPYLFSLVVGESAEAAGIGADPAQLAPILNRLRPYGGMAALGTGNAQAMADAAQAANVDQVEVRADGQHLLARRGGPLTGAGEWTHQYHDAANTLLSRDSRVRLPLGVLWYGGPNNHDILPRHAGGPRPQVAGGRQVYLGVETIGARCVYTGRRLWSREFPGIGHPGTDRGHERNWEGGREVYMTNIPGMTYIGSPFVTQRDSVYLRYQGAVHRLDPATGATLAEFPLPGEPSDPCWGHISVHGRHLVVTSEVDLLGAATLDDLGGENHRGTSSGRLAVLDRFDGTLRWQKTAEVGFRHNAIVGTDDTLFVVDGLSEEVVGRIERRGAAPDPAHHRIMALDVASGAVKWSVASGVFGTYLMYSEEHDILIEGGSQDLRRTLGDEPRSVTARSGQDGRILWQGGRFLLPAAIRGGLLIPGRPGAALSLLTGENWQRRQPHTGRTSNWNYSRRYGCNTLNASEHLLLYRSGYAGFFDLEHDSGTGNFGGFRSGCTSNMLAADGVLNALDYTRTCTCSYALQTSLALVHMPDDSSIEAWTRYAGAFPDPESQGVNFGAPGRRVDSASGRIWHDRPGTRRRHPSAIRDNGGGQDWVAASVREGDGEISVDDLLNATYTVRLHFAELDEAVTAGDRVFDLYLDGEKVLEGFDIVGRTGAPLRGVVETFEAEVNGGGLSIGLRRAEGSRRDPVISGIELIAGAMD